MTSSTKQVATRKCIDAVGDYMFYHDCIKRRSTVSIRRGPTAVRTSMECEIEWDLGDLTKITMPPEMWRDYDECLQDSMGGRLPFEEVVLRKWFLSQHTQMTTNCRQAKS